MGLLSNITSLLTITFYLYRLNEIFLLELPLNYPLMWWHDPQNVSGLKPKWLVFCSNVLVLAWFMKTPLGRTIGHCVLAINTNWVFFCCIQIYPKPSECKIQLDLSKTGEKSVSWNKWTWWTIQPLQWKGKRQIARLHFTNMKYPCNI